MRIATGLAVALALLASATACSSEDGGDAASPTATVTATQTVTATATPEQSEAESDAEYYGISLQDAGDLLECEDIINKENDPAYQGLGLQWHAVGLCASDNGTHNSAVFVFEDEEQMSAAQADGSFAAATSTGLQAPGLIIGCVDDSVCTQFKPLLEGESHT